MSTLTTIQATDLITNSRANINDNFSALNADKLETSVLDTDTTLAANSDSKVPTQKAVKAYVDAGGNVNASDTVKGIVEEATQAEVNAGTQVGATGARLYVNPNVLPSMATVVPYPNVGIDYNQSKTTMGVVTNTTMRLGQVVVPFRITVNKISIYITTVSVAGTMDISLYSEDGQTRLFSVTTATISATGLVTTSVSSVALSPGVYYIAVNPNSTTNVVLSSWYASTAELTTAGLNGGVTSEPIMQGTLTITADTPPSTITPTSITAAITGAIVFRLDN